MASNEESEITTAIQDTNYTSDENNEATQAANNSNLSIHRATPTNSNDPVQQPEQIDEEEEEVRHIKQLPLKDLPGRYSIISLLNSSPIDAIGEWLRTFPLTKCINNKDVTMDIDNEDLVYICDAVYGGSNAAYSFFQIFKIQRGDKNISYLKEIFEDEENSFKDALSILNNYDSQNNQICDLTLKDLKELSIATTRVDADGKSMPILDWKYVADESNMNDVINACLQSRKRDGVDGRAEAMFNIVETRFASNYTISDFLKAVSKCQNIVEAVKKQILRKAGKNIKERVPEVLEEYSMKSVPRGKCIIINNSFEGSNNYRQGTEKDVETLTEVFTWLKFQVEVYNDMTKTEMMEMLKTKVEDDANKRYDCFVCCILSHGYPNGVYCNDMQKCSLSEIHNIFTGHHGKELIDKPKLFFIQACQGDQGSTAVKIAKDSPPSVPSTQPSEDNKDKTIKIISLSTHSDVLFCMSATKGMVSYRNCNEGSWFIQELGNVLIECALKKSLMEMLLILNNKIAARGYEVKMMSDIGKNTLRKNLHFKPDVSYKQWTQKNPDLLSEILKNVDLNKKQ